MGVLDRLRGQKAVIDNFALGISDGTTAGANYSGVPISELGSMTSAAVWACARILYESMGSLPLHVMETAGKFRSRAPNHPLARLLHDAPNPNMSSVSWREAVTLGVALWGNGYSIIERDGRGNPVALWPVRSDRMFIDKWGRQVRYRSTTDEFGGREDWPQDILHVPGIALDGVRGLSPIGACRQAIGISKAAEEFAARMFSQGSRGSGVLSFNRPMEDQQCKDISQRIQQDQSGLAGAHKVLVVGDEAKFTPWTIPPEDAQFLETRKFQATEIARIFRIPPHMIADLERATFSNIEHQALEFVVHTLLPWIVRWEQELNRKLFAAAGQAQFSARFSVEGLLRGDIKSRFEAYAIARTNGWYSANDILELEDRNPIAGGDDRWRPANMLVAGAPLGEQPREAPGEVIQGDFEHGLRLLRQCLARDVEEAA
jgi:HK97 family phage portal protein